MDNYIKNDMEHEHSDYVPVIGTYRNPNKYAGGILPIVYHNGEMFSLMGIDSRLKKYSDFGGGFDVVYTEHTTNTYKSTILQEHQIKNGHISNVIFKDHCASLTPDFVATQEHVEKKYVHPNHVSRTHPKCVLNSHNKYPVGYGDINTLYTALRELMEETASIDNTGNISYLFDLEMMIKKLYIDRSYIYLGGDTKYKYDMYVVILTLNDLSDNLQKWFLYTYSQYKLNPNKYILDKTSDIAYDECYRIQNNNEMMGINMIPLACIVSDTNKINYVNYRMGIRQYNYEIKKTNISLCGNKTTYHTSKYLSPLLDMMRLSFADALIKYNREFSFIVDPYSFKKIKGLLHLIPTDNYAHNNESTI
jgi:hypothetical protein